LVGLFQNRPGLRGKIIGQPTWNLTRLVPPLTGTDFTGEFNTPAKIADVIRSGSVIGRAPIVSMPHWGGILSQADMNALIAYLGTLQ